MDSGSDLPGNGAGSLTSPGRGGILYCVIARGTTVLARHASCVGNFAEISDLVLAKVRDHNQPKMTLTQGEFLFHYVSDDGVIALAIADSAYDRGEAFRFLDSVLDKFLKQFEQRVHSAIAFAMNTEFSPVIASEIKRFSKKASDSSSAGDPDKITTVQAEIDQVKDIMVANIDVIIERGEKLELLVDKTEHLATNSITFRNTSRSLQRAIWWKNMKLTIGLGLGVIVFLYVVVSLACGGLAWSKCVG